jgi:hypothetical protein
VPAVLAPVDEDLAVPLRLGHDSDDVLGAVLLHDVGHSEGELTRVLVAARPVHGDVQLEALGARRLRPRVHLHRGEHVADVEGDRRALGHRRRRTGIEIEDDGAGRVDVPGQRHRRVQLDGGHVGRPHERGGLVELAVVDGAVAIARPGRGGQPVRAVLGAPLLEEARLVDAVGPAPQSEGAARQVGHHHRRDAVVVVDHLGLGEAGLGVQHLVEVAEGDPAAVDVDGRHDSGR